MLKIVTGRLGSGKTTFIHNEIISQIKQGVTDITLIVPEQFSFETEKTMLRKLGALHYPDVSVLSFSRLADRVISPSKLCGRSLITDPSKAALMGLALSSVKDKLTVYAGQSSSPGVINSFLKVQSELELSCVGTDKLRSVADSMGSTILASKLNDIALACDAYDSARSQSYFDTADKLTYLCDELRENHYFRDKLLFIDGFRGFTAIELSIIKQMLIDAKAVYVSLCLERPDADEDDELFSHTLGTYRALHTLANQVGVPFTKPENESMGNKYNNFPPEGIKRFDEPCLAALEKNLYRTDADVYTDNAGAITVCQAPDVYSECEMVACMVKKLVREQGYRYRDIAVVARNSDDYEAPLRSALRKCGVSTFEDHRRHIAASPVIALVLAAVSVAAEGWQTEKVMRILKTGLTNVTSGEISDLENYTYLWQIDGSRWLKDWEFHPSGYGAKLEEKDKEYLARINKIREKAISPLIKFIGRVKLAPAEESSKAVYTLLTDYYAPQNLRTLAAELRSNGENYEADNLASSWEILMKLLDDFVAASGDRNFSVSQFAEVINLMFNMQTVGDIPTGIDEVTIGSADRIRLDCPKAVFIIGANYGEFPAVRPENPPFNEKDRQILADNDIALASFGEHKLREERIIAYSAFCCAKQKLFVCYHLNDGSGASEPSELVGRIRELFPKHTEIVYENIPAEDFAESRQTAFNVLARQKPLESPAYHALREYFEGDEEYSGKIAALDRTGNMSGFKIEDKSLAEALYGKSMSLSASRVEQFYKCPFSYFCNYGIGAKANKPAEIDVLQRGTIIHYALEKLLGRYKDNEQAFMSLTYDERYKVIKEILDGYLEENLGGRENKTERFMHNYSLIVRTVAEISERLVSEFAVSKFRPVEFELKIGDDEDNKVEAYTVTLPDGETVKIYGSIDRVDTAEVDGRNYLRIVDYKSGGKDFKLGNVYNGLNMQMLIYLFAISASSSDYSQDEPAGVLYYPAKAPSIGIDRSESEEKIAKAKNEKAGTKGIVLENMDVITAMDSEMSGFFAPVKYSKGKLSGALITEKQLENLRTFVDSKICGMAMSLREGTAGAYPAEIKGESFVCDYCDYKAACFYEDGNPHNVISIPSDEDVKKILDNGGEK